MEPAIPTRVGVSHDGSRRSARNACCPHAPEGDPNFLPFLIPRKFGKFGKFDPDLQSSEIGSDLDHIERSVFPPSP
jgi:hypothetical protein